MTEKNDQHYRPRIYAFREKDYVSRHFRRICGQFGSVYFCRQMPEFPDGERALFKFLIENIQIPIIPQLSGIQGRIISRFV